MNIFVTSSCPVECAKALDDKRVNKMLLESVQILSTVMHLTGQEGRPYKPTHKGHPCTLWAARSLGNYKWLWQHADALLEEYKRRSGKPSHGCEGALRACMWGSVMEFPKEELTPFVNCTPYKDVEDVYTAYQMTLNDKWESDKRPPTWGGEGRGI